jgi:hypothetical protein
MTSHARMSPSYEDQVVVLLRDGATLTSALKHLDLARSDFDRYCVENYGFAVQVAAAKRAGQVKSGKAAVVRGDELAYLPDALRP